MLRKRLLIFISLVVFSIFLMTVQVKLGPFNPLSFLAYPLNSMNSFINSVIVHVTEPVTVIRAAAGENERLEKEIDELKIQLQEFKEIKAENERYRNLLALKEHDPLVVAAASVISRGMDQSVRSLILDKGSDDGIDKEMIATTPDGLAGKIIRVWPQYAEMLLITDSSFSVSVRIEENRLEGILTGDGRGGCRLNYITNEEEVKEGDRLITSGLDRFYPAGVPAGKVRIVQKTTPELFQSITVTPSVNTSRLEEVMITHR
jgi:rod shape-determining protein MreC